MDEKRYLQYLLGLRKRVVQKDNNQLKLLLANFSETEQQKDIERRTSVIDDFFRVKINVKAFSEKERKISGLKPLDFSNNEEVFSALRDEFDFPYWTFTSLQKPTLQDCNNTFIYQLKACNLYCIWCFVDDSNKNASLGSGRFFEISEILDVFEKEKQSQIVHAVRPSGGEPTLAVEQWLELLRGLEKKNLEAYVQGDTNLTTGLLIEHLEKSGEIEKDFLKKVAEYKNFGLLCSFKGTDKQSFHESTKANPNLCDGRWHTFKKFIDAGIDAYPFIYAPNPHTLESFLEEGAKIFGDGFYLKTWIFKLKIYEAEKVRLRKLGINPEEYQKKLDENFIRSKEKMQEIIWKKFKINYQAIPRTGIKLKSI